MKLRSTLLTHKAEKNHNRSVRGSWNQLFVEDCLVCLKKNRWAVAFFVVINILLCIALGLVARNREKDVQQVINTNPAEPFYTNPEFVNPTALSEFKEELKQLYAQHSLDSSVLKDDAGKNASRFAMYWMASAPTNNLNVEQHEKSKRFVLFCFYCSTNMVASPYATAPMYWRSAIDWLTPKPACEWKGINCNDKLQVISISMERNHLSGVLPFELAIIADNLRTLEFTSNCIYMEGDAFRVFESLVNLEYLYMNDNFLVTTKGFLSICRYD